MKMQRFCVRFFVHAFCGGQCPMGGVFQYWVRSGIDIIWQKSVERSTTINLDKSAWIMKIQIMLWQKSIFLDMKNQCVQNGSKFRLICRILYPAFPMSRLYYLTWNEYSMLCSDDCWHVQGWQMLCGLKQYWPTWISYTVTGTSCYFF